MSGMRLKRENISPQIIHMCESNSNPCHIRDSEYLYVYINPAMAELLDLPKGFNIEGKLITDISHWMAVFLEEIYRHDKIVMDNRATLSLLITSAFGRKNTIQPYIFDVRPFFDDVGTIVGTITEAKPCKFFSPLQYIDGESPIALTSNIPYNRFTDRDLDVMFFTYHGLTSKETARRLGISHRTVENRLCIMYQKAGVHNIYQFREFCRDIDIDCYIPPDFMQHNIRVID
ncbi:Bacterial regulatory proteins, luxR family [Sodalis glossinidius str. 'morsitans']|uniref:Bacterial regulatory proteins, luxR family n=1 Tax=Sodalis glossinidius (strain morsitans) TaxID=343509 RepID=A0A193QGZ8_SODGM|nr:PAS and helix-turn-helix domain-containing protein [Sodalis glossinidius]CRL44459.1 Bacterial regulatory proteins, luxR family [Sodalis glossinidius str. 'morsitans']